MSGGITQAERHAEEVQALRVMLDESSLEFVRSDPDHLQVELVDVSDQVERVTADFSLRNMVDVLLDEADEPWQFDQLRDIADHLDHLAKGIRRVLADVEDDKP